MGVGGDDSWSPTGALLGRGMCEQRGPPCWLDACVSSLGCRCRPGSARLRCVGAATTACWACRLQQARMAASGSHTPCPPACSARGVPRAASAVQLRPAAHAAGAEQRRQRQGGGGARNSRVAGALVDAFLGLLPTLLSLSLAIFDSPSLQLHPSTSEKRCVHPGVIKPAAGCRRCCARGVACACQEAATLAQAPSSSACVCCRGKLKMGGGGLPLQPVSAISADCPARGGACAAAQLATAGLCTTSPWR